MKIIHLLSLHRGRALMDVAYNRGETPMDFETADLIGIVAAYISHGDPIVEMEQRLTTALGPGIAADAVRILETFNDEHGRGLWMQGPALDDMSFTDRKLDRFYPEVNKRRARLLDGTQPDEAPDQVF